MKEYDCGRQVHGEECPTEVDPNKCSGTADCAFIERPTGRRGDSPMSPQPVQDQERSMPRAPDQEVEPGAMPDSAHQHRDQQVDINSSGRNTGPTQWNENVIH